MSAFILILAIVLLVVVIVQISKATELISVLKNSDEEYEKTNSTTALILSVSGFAILVLSIVTIFTYSDRFLPPSASEQGEWIQKTINLTIGFTGFVYVITQALLFWFVYKYQYRKKRKAYFYPDNNKLELAWTVIPALVMTVLVVLGIQKWFKIFSPVPSEAIVIEATGKQFMWIVRYPGIDRELGPRDFTLVNSDNELGINWNAESSHDDFIADVIVLPVNTAVKVKIGALDVLHDFGLPQFRLKMDAVPGIPTEFWFRPTITTDSMRLITGKADFDYEVSCNQLCGSGHYNMRKVLKIVSKSEYDKWVKEQKSYYQTVVLPAMQSKGAVAEVSKDSTAVKPM